MLVNSAEECVSFIFMFQATYSPSLSLVSRLFYMYYIVSIRVLYELYIFLLFISFRYLIHSYWLPKCDYELQQQKQQKKQISLVHWRPFFSSEKREWERKNTAVAAFVSATNNLCSSLSQNAYLIKNTKFLAIYFWQKICNHIK